MSGMRGVSLHCPAGVVDLAPLASSWRRTLNKKSTKSNVKLKWDSLFNILWCICCLKDIKNTFMSPMVAQGDYYALIMLLTNIKRLFFLFFFLFFCLLISIYVFDLKWSFFPPEFYDFIRMLSCTVEWNITQILNPYGYFQNDYNFLQLICWLEITSDVRGELRVSSVVKDTLKHIILH